MPVLYLIISFYFQHFQFISSENKTCQFSFENTERVNSFSIGDKLSEDSESVSYLINAQIILMASPITFQRWNRHQLSDYYLQTKHLCSEKGHDAFYFLLMNKIIDYGFIK